jgi:sugar lactone lactonase YvrE
MRREIIAILGVTLLVACAREAEGPTIVIERGIIPEGIEYDQTNRRILSGSFAEGTVFQIHEDGRLTPVITDPEVESSVGIEVDEARQRMLVVVSDDAALRVGTTGYAKLAVYDSATGERLAMVDLAAVLGNSLHDPPRYFANDVAVDGAGNAYVTEMLNDAIYKVTPDYQASVLYRFPLLETSERLNGIVHHEDGYLLVTAGRRLVKVPVGNPQASRDVALDEPLDRQDGLVWATDGRLVSVSNSTSSPQAVAFTSNDDWATARRVGVARLVGQASTAAAVGNDIWVVHPQFSGSDPPSLELAVFH